MDTLQRTDTILGVKTEEGNKHTQVEMSIDDFAEMLNNVPEGSVENVFDQILDLTALGAKFLKAVTVPAGAIIKSAGLYITETVVAGGTTVKVALGQHGGTTNAYGTSADLLVDTKFNNLVTPAVLSGATDVDLNAVTTAGTALGDTNVSAGKVRVVVVYDTMNALAA